MCELKIFLFLTLSYFIGNNKFPHNLIFVPIITLAVGAMILMYSTSDYLLTKHKNDESKSI